MARETVSDELKKYGYVFSKKKTLISIVAVFFVTFGLGKLFRLDFFYEVVLGVFLIIFLPFFIRNSERSRYVQKRFSDVNVYIEQFLYSFEKTGKVLETLYDVKEIFEDGLMKKKIEMAINHIANSYDSDSEKDALSIIENEYKYEGLKLIHEFALGVEREGGEYRSSAKILLDDRRLWMDRVLESLNEKKRRRNRNTISILMSLILCSMIYFISFRMDIDVSKNIYVQFGTSLVLILDILIFFLSDRKMSEDYLTTKDTKENRAYKLQEKWKDFKDVKIPFMKRLFYKSEKRLVIREIEKAFPRWILDMVLLLQNDNVFVSIEKSYEKAPLVLKRDLEILISELKINPTGIMSYVGFMKQYGIPDVEAAMKVLYSLSENGNGQVVNELGEILTRNRQMIDRASKIKNEDNMAGMEALFLAPQITAGIKMICDMMVMFGVYLSDVGKIGV
ncbi:MAG: hypothetical protein K5851_08200 [Lachnospiraceae bacterium]|nr:hypothetical protein [Lachnospiraceae bacterium]